MEYLVLRPFTAESPGNTKVHQRGIYSSFSIGTVGDKWLVCVCLLLYFSYNYTTCQCSLIYEWIFLYATVEDSEFHIDLSLFLGLHDRSVNSLRVFAGLMPTAYFTAIRAQSDI